MTASGTERERRIPVFQGLLPIDRRSVTGDIVAGITLAALGIPQAMGYTKIAGTPVVTGLYALLLPLVAFALLGGSRYLVVTADSATAAILAATLSTLAPLGSPGYVGRTSVVALLVAGLLALARLFRLGFLADFLSRSALIGFLTGVGIQIAGGELAHLLGVAKEGQGTLDQIASAVARVGSVHLPTLGVSLAVLGIIVGGKRVAPRAPSALAAVVLAIAASAAFDLGARGIATLGSVPSGVPSLAFPALHLDELHQVLACAASCLVVIIAQSAATARAAALRHHEPFTENPDLVGLAGANLAAALSGTFVVNGSPTNTMVVESVGGRSQVAHLTTATVVLIVLLFLTGPLSMLPSAALSAIVFTIGVRLIDGPGMRDLFRLGGKEFWIALITAATVVGFSVMDGVAIAVVLSLIDQVQHTYRPRTRVVIQEADGLWHGMHVAPDRFAAPGVVAYRFEANLFYANASRFMDEVLALVAASREPVKAVVIDAAGIDDVDYTAGKMLLEVRDALAKRDIAMAIVAAHGPVRAVVQAFGLCEGARAIHLYPTLDCAVTALSSGRPIGPRTEAG